MRVIDLIWKNVEITSTAVEMIEQSAKGADGSKLVKEKSKTHDMSDIATGMFLATLVLFRLMENSGVNRSDLKSFLIREATAAHLKGLDTSNHYKVIDLFELSTGDGGAFFMKAYGIRNPSSFIIHMLDCFKDICFKFYKNGRNTDTLEVIPTINLYLEHISKSKQDFQLEQCRLIESLKKEPEETEHALKLIDTLSPHFTVFVKSDGEKIQHLSSNVLDFDDVYDAFRVTDEVELLRSTCLLTGLILSKYITNEGLVAPLIQSRLAEVGDNLMDDPDDDDLLIEIAALEAVEHILGVEDSDFYKKADSIDDVFGAILALISNLYRTTMSTLHTKLPDITAELRELLKQ